jgi:CRP-like cAMP-binding protein
MQTNAPTHRDVVTENVLISRLPRSVYARIKPDLTLVSLSSRTIIHKPGEAIQDLYFPTTSMISIALRMQDGATVETGAIGRREVAGINALMGGQETTQTEYIVQLPGDALKIAAATVKVAFERNEEMRKLMLKYMQAFIAQISQNVACNRLHETDRRFARWLLEVRDRVQSGDFILTHEFISEMLGVRRASVTVAASHLKAKGIIEYNRGHIKIMNVRALEKLSCECYQCLQNEYRRLLA